MEKLNIDKDKILEFKDIEDLTKKCGCMLGGDYFNPATKLRFDSSILGDTLSVSIALAFRENIIRTLDGVLNEVKNDKRFKNVDCKGNSIIADLVNPVGEIVKVNFIVEKYKV